MEGYESQGGGLIGLIFGGGMFVVMMVILLVVIASMWKVFAKAGKPGWAALVPIYNLVVMLQITGQPIWFIVLFFIPCVNWIMAFVVMIALAKSFGKGVGYGIGLALLGIIFFPMLAFGSAEYQGPAASA